MKLIDDSLPKNIKIALCGLADEENLKRINKIGIQNRISYIGWIDGAEKDALLKRTIVNVLPSYREGLPMTILETMALGIPNIVSDISTIPEVIQNGENGLLVSPGNVRQIADLIKRVVMEDSFRKKLSHNSYETISSRFEIGKHIKKIETIYKNLFEEQYSC